MVIFFICTKQRLNLYKTIMKSTIKAMKNIFLKLFANL